MTITGGEVGQGFEVFNSQVTISGGEVEHGFGAHEDSMVTISGGTVGFGVNARDGSTVTISGGVVGNDFRAHSGSQVTLSGGSVGDRFSAFAGSNVTLSGGLFKLDGVLIPAVSSPGQSVLVDIPDNALFTGVLADGTPFAFHSDDVDLFDSGTLRLSAVALPAVGAADDHRINRLCSSGDTERSNPGRGCRRRGARPF